MAYSGEAHSDGTVDRLIARALASPLPAQRPEVFALTAEAAIAHDMGQRRPGLAVPTLILVGDEHRVCPPRLAQFLRDAIIDSHARVVGQRGHQPFQDDPGQFMAALAEFHRSLPRRGDG